MAKQKLSHHLRDDGSHQPPPYQWSYGFPLLSEANLGQKETSKEKGMQMQMEEKERRKKALVGPRSLAGVVMLDVKWLSLCWYVYITHHLVEELPSSLVAGASLLSSA